MTMDDKEITALAREFAEETRNGVLGLFPQPLPDSMEVLIKNDQEYYGRFLRWITNRYCLVEKERVKQMYKEAIEGKCELEKMQPQNTYAKNSIAMRIGVNMGCIHTLKSLFPEIAKEVEG